MLKKRGPGSFFSIYSQQMPHTLSVPQTSIRYVKLRVAHAPGMPGTFFPPPTLKATASKRSRYACVTHVPWCMSGSLTLGGRKNVPGIPGGCATHNFTYLARGALANWETNISRVKFFHRLLTLPPLPWNLDKYPCFHMLPLEFGILVDIDKRQNSRVLC